MMTSRNTGIGATFAAQNISCMRGSRQVLRGVDIDTSSGQIVGLMGANGAGKTTFFDVLCGLRTASSGRFVGQIRTDRIAYLTQTITAPDALRLGELAELIFGVAGRDNTKRDVGRRLGGEKSSINFQCYGIDVRTVAAMARNVGLFWSSCWR